MKSVVLLVASWRLSFLPLLMGKLKSLGCKTLRFCISDERCWFKLLVKHDLNKSLFLAYCLLKERKRATKKKVWTVAEVCFKVSSHNLTLRGRMTRMGLLLKCNLFFFYLNISVSLRRYVPLLLSRLEQQGLEVSGSVRLHAACDVCVPLYSVASNKYPVFREHPSCFCQVDGRMSR